MTIRAQSPVIEGDINRNQVSLTGLGLYWELLTLVQEHFSEEAGASLEIALTHTNTEGAKTIQRFNFECDPEHLDPSKWGSPKPTDKDAEQ